jgi:hypothetical protein
LTLPCPTYPNVKNTYLINNLFPFVLSLAPIPYGTSSTTLGSYIKPLLTLIKETSLSPGRPPGIKMDPYHTGYAFYYNNLLILLKCLQRPFGFGLISYIKPGKKKIFSYPIDQFNCPKWVSLSEIRYMTYLGLDLTLTKFITYKHSLNLNHLVMSLSYTKASGIIHPQGVNLSNYEFNLNKIIAGCLLTYLCGEATLTKKDLLTLTKDHRYKNNLNSYVY